MTTAGSPTVFAVDDHPDDLLLIRDRCKTVGIDVRTFRVPSEFLAEVPADAIGCVVADLLMPGMTGLQLHSELLRRGMQLPVILTTGHADVASCRVALKNGVFDYVEKSLDPNEMLFVIQRALKKNEEDWRDFKTREMFLEKLSGLSPREKDVMYQLAQGKSLKDVAQTLEISVQTTSKHRVSLFKKLEIDNEIDLLKMLIAVDPNHASREPSAA